MKRPVILAIVEFLSFIYVCTLSSTFMCKSFFTFIQSEKCPVPVSILQCEGGGLIDAMYKDIL